MKTKIKVKVLTEGCMPAIIEKGDWIDLRAAKDVYLKAPQSGVLKEKTINGETVRLRDVKFESELIPLGVAIKLPKGYEAELKGRSSLTRKHGVIMACSGVIDNSYCGNDDEWLFNALAVKEAHISKDDRICQFRVKLSQKATIWQKIKWLFSSGVELVEVDDLGDNNRGGFGSTGIK